MKSSLGNILVVSLQGIGDLVLVTPLLRALKAAYPLSKLAVLTFESNKEVLNSNPSVDNIITFRATDKLNIIKIAVFLATLRREHFDLAICAYPSGLRSALIAYLIGAGERFGQRFSMFRNYKWLFTKQAPVTEIKHAVLLNLDFLKLLGIDPDDAAKEPIFHISDEDTRFALDFLRSSGINDGDLIISIHAGGGSERSWQQERFGEVADVLIEKKNAKIIFIGSSKETALVEKIRGSMKGKSSTAAGRMNLAQTGALLKQTKFLICNNSGPMHIAAALDIPTVSFSGPVDQKIHGPLGKRHIILESFLDCRPCYYPFFRDTLEETKKRNRWLGKAFRCKTGDYRCLADITTGQVIEAAEEILKDG